MKCPVINEWTDKWFSTTTTTNKKDFCTKIKNARNYLSTTIEDKSPATNLFMTMITKRIHSKFQVIQLQYVKSAFSMVATMVWNDLPSNIRAAHTCYESFKGSGHYWKLSKTSLLTWCIST